MSKGLKWILIGGLASSLLFTIGANKKVPLVTDYCKVVEGEAIYSGEVTAKTPTTAGEMITFLNPGSKNCPLKTLIRVSTSTKIGVGDTIRFKGVVSGPYLGSRDIEINPVDVYGLGPNTASIEVNIERWKILDHRNWDGSYWFQLRDTQYDGVRLSISGRMMSEIRVDGCYRVSWNRRFEVVGVDPCSS